MQRKITKQNSHVIMRLALEGRPVGQLASDFGVHHQRVTEIVREEVMRVCPDLYRNLVQSPRGVTLARLRQHKLDILNACWEPGAKLALAGAAHAQAMASF